MRKDINAFPTKDVYMCPTLCHATIEDVYVRLTLCYATTKDVYTCPQTKDITESPVVCDGLNKLSSVVEKNSLWPLVGEGVWLW